MPEEEINDEMMDNVSPVRAELQSYSGDEDQPGESSPYVVATDEERIIVDVVSLRSSGVEVDDGGANFSGPAVANVQAVLGAQLAVPLSSEQVQIESTSVNPDDFDEYAIRSQDNVTEEDSISNQGQLHRLLEPKQT